MVRVYVAAKPASPPPRRSQRIHCGDLDMNARLRLRRKRGRRTRPRHGSRSRPQSVDPCLDQHEGITNPDWVHLGTPRWPSTGTTPRNHLRARCKRYTNRNLARTLPTNTHSPRRFNSPTHKRRSSRWYFYYRECAIAGGTLHFEKTDLRYQTCRGRTRNQEKNGAYSMCRSDIRFKLTVKALAAPS